MDADVDGVVDGVVCEVDLVDGHFGAGGSESGLGLGGSDWFDGGCDLVIWTSREILFPEQIDCSQCRTNSISTLQPN